MRRDILVNRTNFIRNIICYVIHKLQVLILWVMTQCTRFLRNVLFIQVDPEDGGSIFFRNVDIHRQDYMESQSRSLYSKSSQLLKRHYCTSYTYNVLLKY